MQTLGWKFLIALKRVETMTKFRIKNYDYFEENKKNNWKVFSFAKLNRLKIDFPFFDFFFLLRSFVAFAFINSMIFHRQKKCVRIFRFNNHSTNEREMLLMGQLFNLIFDAVYFIRIVY